MIENALKFHKVLGVIFLALMLFSVWLVNAVFTKKFADYDEVQLQASSVGLNLPTRADVKIRGVIVGEVLETVPTKEGANLTLGFYPGMLDEIPKNVTGLIVPKTLFGEKYVALQVPKDPQGELTTKDVIRKAEVGTEVEEVLNDLYPLLTAVQPAQLNMTLNAIATALEGRGDKIGENLETLDAYLKRLNPQIPGLIEDLNLTTKVSDIYADALPEIATILDNTIKTTTTLKDREAKLNALFKDVSSFSGTAETFLNTNGDNLTRLAQLSSQQLRVLARYSTEFPCLTQGVVNGGKLFAEALRGFVLHIILETLPRQPRSYTPDDKPRIDENRGPNCLHLPNPPWTQANPVRKLPDFNDGVDEPTGKGTSRVLPSYSGSPADREYLRSYMSATETPDSDYATMLAGPLVGGPITVGGS